MSPEWRHFLRFTSFESILGAKWNNKYGSPPSPVVLFSKMNDRPGLLSDNKGRTLLSQIEHSSQFGHRFFLMHILAPCLSIHPVLNTHKWMLTRLWKHPPEVWNTEHLPQALIAGITITIKQLWQHTVDVSYKSFQICIKQVSLCSFQLTEWGSMLQHHLLAPSSCSGF